MMGCFVFYGWRGGGELIGGLWVLALGAEERPSVAAYPLDIGVGVIEGVRVVVGVFVGVGVSVGGGGVGVDVSVGIGVNVGLRVMVGIGVERWRWGCCGWASAVGSGVFDGLRSRRR